MKKMKTDYDLFENFSNRSVRMFAISSKTVRLTLTFDSLKRRPGFWEDYKLSLTNEAKFKIKKKIKKPKKVRKCKNSEKCG